MLFMWKFLTQSGDIWVSCTPYQHVPSLIFGLNTKRKSRHCYVVRPSCLCQTDIFFLDMTRSAICVEKKRCGKIFISLEVNHRTFSWLKSNRLSQLTSWGAYKEESETPVPKTYDMTWVRLDFGNIYSAKRTNRRKKTLVSSRNFQPQI